MTAPPSNDSAPPSYLRLMRTIGLLAMGSALLSLAGYIYVFWPRILPALIQGASPFMAMVALALGCSALEEWWSMHGSHLRPRQQGGAAVTPHGRRSRL